MRRAFVTLVLVLALVAGSSALAFEDVKKEFSADQVVKGPMGMEQRSKVFMAKKMARYDEGQRSTIVRWDKNVTWMLNNQDKTYFESAIQNDKMPMTMRDMEKSVERKKLGEEKVEGRACEKYQVKMDLQKAMAAQMAKEKDEEFKKFMSQMKKEITLLTWMDKELGVPVKTQMEDGTTTLLTNIKVAAQPKSLFEIPAGYKKVSTPPAAGLPAGGTMPKGMPQPGSMPQGQMPPDMEKMMKQMGGQTQISPETQKMMKDMGIEVGKQTDMEKAMRA
ncbi:MAG: DUF4412 domain-containing protein, partial [Thermodesulfobacteriota bacterium]